MVLQRYLSFREEFGVREKQCRLVNILYSELISVLKPARIFTLTERKCKKIIDSLISKFTDFKKPIYKGSGSTNKYKVFLAKLCDLAPSNLKELLQGTYRPYKLREENWQFYLNMCKAKQAGCVVGMDVKLAVK